MPSKQNTIAAGKVATLTLLLVALWCGGSTRAFTIGSESPIVNGLATENYPPVGALLFSQLGSPTTAVGICTGTLIGCQTFATAAHCVCDTVGANCQPGQPGAPNPSQYFVFLPHVGVIPVQSIAVRSDFDFPKGDVAILRLDAPAGNIRPARINTQASPPNGTPGTIVGYGLTGGGKTDYGIKRYGNVVTTECTNGISSQTSVCWAFRSPLGDPATNSNTCNGDSGGPLFVDFGTGPLLAGIASGGTSEGCLPPDDSYDANVYNYRSWIETQAGSDLNATACGSEAQVGDPEVTVLAFTATASTGQGVTYDFEVPPQTVELRVTSNATRDFDLYVRSAPGVTREAYDCKDDGSSPMAACRFPSPTNGPWSALVYPYGGSGAYQITITMIPATCQGAADGSPCDDDNDCTENDQCRSGTCVGTPRPDGSPCFDGNRCTNPDQCASGVCVGGSSPQTGCKRVTVAGGSMLRIGTPSNRPPSLVWRWSRGQSTDPVLFGDPRGATDFDVCLYVDQGGQPTLLWEKNVSPGGFCGRNRPCWVQTGKGFRYTNRSGAPLGVTRLQLTGGTEGNASILFKAGTTNFLPPGLPIALPAKIQLVNDYACWEADFSAAIRNDAGTFRARSDP
ncbi:MAG: trypsin-like serine protease [Candidatus Binatia bacterium]|nr:trypsin-like serine protease [Candidatus Binatia bacterium]